MTHILIVQFAPTEYEEWREFHGRQLDQMKSAGIVSDRICRNIAEPDKLVVLFEVEDFERYTEFMSSPAAQAMAASAPIKGVAEVIIAELLDSPL